MFQSTEAPIYICHICSYQNPDTASICLNCNAALGINCPACGQAIPADTKFCGQCGARLSGSPLAPPGLPGAIQPALPSQVPTALAEKIKLASVKTFSERREVTVLFLDVVNFTAAAHRLDHEEVYHFIDEAIAQLIDVIYKYEGTVDKFTGDGLMALFGAPVAHENDPERAIRAALDIQTVIQPLQLHIQQTYGFDFQVRIGINTGPVIAGNLGSEAHMEYTVIGDTVNLASRLEAAASPGTVLISAETYHRTHLLFQFEALPALTIKGVQQPLPAYRPLRVLENPGSLRGLPGLQTKMVGRDSELASLHSALATVKQTGQSRLALVTGEAGLGKSRLVLEFCRLTPPEIKVYQGNCLTYARAVPLGLVAALFREIIGTTETASSQAQQQAVQSYLAQLNLAVADISAYLIHALGLENPDPGLEARLKLLDAATLQQQTHAALRQILLAEARQALTVLIFEDLHWVDPASRDFLEYLIQTTPDAPLFFILVSRQLERQTVIRPLILAATQPPARLIDLPLPALLAADGHLMVDQLIPRTSPAAVALKQRIVARAEGNPFYVEEMIRMLIDRGGLVRSAAGDTWTITRQAGQLLNEIPGTVKDLILARVDRLPAGVRQTLQKAAVLGLSFPIELLQQVSQYSNHTLHAHLNELKNRHFINPHPVRAKSSCTFQHALLQETVYGTLLKRDRGQIHAEVAGAIDQSSLWLPEEKIEALAYHYVRSANPSQAIPYLIAAAENSARRCANETAVAHYRRAMALLPGQLLSQEAEPIPGNHIEAFFQVRLGLGQALKYLGEFAEAKQILSEALEQLWTTSLAADALTLQPILVESLRQLADVEQRAGNYDDALSLLRAGIQALGETGPQVPPRLRGTLLERMAWIRFRLGQLDGAYGLAQTAVKDLSAAGSEDPLTLASLFNTLGGLAWQQGHLDEAISFVEQSLHLYEGIDYYWGKAVAYGNLGILHDLQGRWTEATNSYQQAYELHQLTGDRQNQAHNLDNLGTLHLSMGDHYHARQELEAALAIRQQLGDSWGIAQSQVNLADLARVQQHFEATTALAQAALELAESIGSTEIEIQARWLLALVEAEKGSAQLGLQLAEQALELAQTVGLVEKEGECLWALGLVLTRAGQYAQAETRLQEALALATKQAARYRQGLAWRDLGRLYQQLSQAQPADNWQDKALSAWQEAGRIFEHLGATYDQSQANNALSHLKGSNGT